MRVLVCGGIDFNDRYYLYDTLYDLDDGSRDEITLIIDGGAKGADQMGYEWARQCDIPTKRYFADWDKHGKAAGPIRNQQMLDEGKPDLVVAFPTKNSSGTWHMVKIAREADVEVLVYE